MKCRYRYSSPCCSALPPRPNPIASTRSKSRPPGFTQNLYLLEGEGGNIGVSAGDDGVFVIDDQFAPLTARILAAIKAISDKPVRLMINTHWHFDHTGRQ